MIGIWPLFHYLEIAFNAVADAKDRIAGADPETLRPSRTFNPNVRRQVKRDADALMEQFAGYFAPAGATDREAA